MLFRLIGALAIAALGALSSPVNAQERAPVILGTATPGGGFELYGGVLAEEVNKIDPSLNLLARNTGIEDTKS